MASASNMLCFSVFAVLCLSRVLCAENDIITETPEYIIPCSRSDPKLDVCIRSSFQHLRPYLVAGIPELGLPSVEPMFIDRLVMENGNGPVRVKAVFTNVTVKGASNFTVTRIRSDLSRLRIDLGVSVPKVEIVGKYEVTGNVLLFPVRSQGDFWAAFMDIAGIGKIYGKEVVRDDITFMTTDRLLVDFKLQKSRFKIKDTVNHGSIIGEAMNQFLNNNAAEIIEEMRPAASASVARHFQCFLNGAISKIPMDLWLKP